MGAPNSPHEDICDNVFFNDIDWKKLERRQLDPPFKPQVVSEDIQFIIFLSKWNWFNWPFFFHRNIL